MKKYGVIGYPLSHSFSPQYFKKKFVELGIEDCTYSAFELSSIDRIREFSEAEGLSGFNVTVPYKQSIIVHLDHLTDAAKAIGAVNTVTVKESKLYGDNTDYIGFARSLKKVLGKRSVRALVFGTGGSSLAVRFALRQLGVLHSSVSRGALGDFAYNEITSELLNEHKLLIQTTPLGMFPNEHESIPIPYDAIGEKHICFDLIYNPEMSEFLKKAKSQGAEIKNGLQMLEIQADKSWDIWNS